VIAALKRCATQKLFQVCVGKAARRNWAARRNQWDRSDGRGRPARAKILYIMAVKGILQGWFYGDLVVEGSLNQQDGGEKAMKKPSN
jgi:hypothetical protein